jgi:formylglycine-generating enzyme required for sulfatase activity
MTDRDEVETSDDPALLRAEIVRLRGELDSLRRDEASARDVDSVTDRLALQQEVDTLRRSLREKERVVDVTAAQCRRLEDELEDQYLASDGLKQDLERKKASLAAAREQAARLSKERQELEERYQALLNDASSITKSETASGAVALGPPRVSLPPASDGRFIGGVVAGAVLGASLLVVLLRPDLLPFADAPPPSSGSGPAVAQMGPGPEVSGGEADWAGAGPQDAGDEGTGDAEPELLRTVRDRLGDGSFGPLMLAIAPGHFTMGKLRALPTDDQGPAHRVNLDGYLIGATEVTFEEYDRFVRATGGRFPNDFGWGRGRRPVVDVNWSEAVEYAEWLSAETGRPYRLPSEAEWEYAAAAGQRTPYWWGFQVEKGRAVCFDCGTLWDNRSTAPAGTFDPNPLGLYDTAGNAMEWVADCYHPNYVGAPADGSAWGADNCRYRVARGGAFNKPARSMGSTVRHRFDPGTRLNMLGFRLARDG